MLFRALKMKRGVDGRLDALQLEFSLHPDLMHPFQLKGTGFSEEKDD
jgi:hypothetical protein